jgi:hypothetical protein
MTICNKDALTYYTTDNGVRYAELNGVSADTGGFDAALGSMSGERSFYLPDYSTSSGFIEWMLGIKFSRTGISPNGTPRRMFQQAPLIATNVKIDGVGEAVGPYESVDYPEGCIALVTYGLLDFNTEEDKQGGDPNEDPFSTSNINISCDFGTASYALPKEGLEGEGNVKLNESDDRFYYIYPVGTVTITRQNVIDFGLADYIAELGNLNSAVYAGFPRGHLMFTGVNTNVSLANLAIANQDIGYLFSFRGIGPDEGWTKVWQTKRTAPAQDAGWRKVNKIGGQEVYTYSNFSSLIPELA